jgi:hypothetical protein
MRLTCQWMRGRKCKDERHCSVTAELDRERCAICRKEMADGNRFCRFYEVERTLAFCSPHCAELHLQATSTAASDDGELIASWVEHLRWTCGNLTRPESAVARDEGGMAIPAEPVRVPLPIVLPAPSNLLCPTR